MPFDRRFCILQRLRRETKKEAFPGEAAKGNARFFGEGKSRSRWLTASATSIVLQGAPFKLLDKKFPDVSRHDECEE